MYQTPDFVKVDLDIKDNFAAYSGCYQKEGIVYTVMEGTMCTDHAEEAGIMSSTDPSRCWVNSTSY